MNRFPGHLFAAALVLLQTLAHLAPAAVAQTFGQGQWQTLPYTMPINPVHVALLYNGKVLIVSGSGNVAGNTNFQAALWDPQAGTITTQRVAWDMFCNGMVVLPDGRPIVMGGTLQYDPFHGELRTSTYDPVTNTFTDQQSMAHGRWYPTGTVLGDGRVMVFSGLNETGGTNTSVEFYSASTGWSPAFSAPWTPPLYPRMHVLPNGNVFYSGSTTASSLFNPATHTWTTNIAFTNYSGTRTYGTSVLLPLTPANGYKPRVMIFGGGSPSTATTELIDLSAATPKWVFGPNMSQPRIEMDATILPNGKVLALGGSLNDEDTATASLNADLYDPATNTFSSAGAELYARLYHSISVLMPDATVWVAGGNPQRGSYEPHMEIYSPGYLFNSNGTLATRPSITGVPTSRIGYGTAFQVQTPDATGITSVVLIRPGAPTHAFDMEQRLVAMNFTAGSGVLNVTAPPNGNIAPPGYYMLFILNSSGVPSVAQFVQLTPAPADKPPAGSITSPATDVTIPAGQSVYFSGSGSDPDGTITAYSWSFPGGSPSTSSLATPGNVIYNTPGIFAATLTVTDNAGLADPNPPSRRVTVGPAPDFSISATPSSQSVVQGNSTNYTVTITPSNGFSGTASFSVSGLPSGASASFTPSTISRQGTTTLNVATSSSTPLGSYTLVITGSSASLSHGVTVNLTVTSSTATTVVNFGSGFTATGMQFNGHTKLNGTRLQLTDTTATSEVGSAFWKQPLNIQSFTTDFTFQLANPNADGFTVTIQNVGPAAIGPAGGGLGYGPDKVTNPAPSSNAPVAKSVAVKFDLYNNAGEGTNSIGLYTNGASPTVPAITLGNGVNLHSGDIFSVHIAYDGTTLTMKITDTANAAQTFTTSWTINVPAVVGGNGAYVGFTGGTGGLTATQEVLTWTYSNSGTVKQPVVYRTANLAAVSSGPTFRKFDYSGFPDTTGTILDATKAGDYVTFNVNVATPGTYDIQVSYKNYSTRGIWQLAINGGNTGPRVDEYRSTDSYAVSDLGNFIFPAPGNYSFKFIVTGRNTSSAGYTISFDDFTLTPQ